MYRKKFRYKLKTADLWRQKKFRHKEINFEYKINLVFKFFKSYCNYYFMIETIEMIETILNRTAIKSYCN